MRRSVMRLSCLVATLCYDGQEDSRRRLEGRAALARPFSFALHASEDSSRYSNALRFANASDLAMAFALLALFRRDERFLYVMRASLHPFAIFIAALMISIVDLNLDAATAQQRPSTDPPPAS